MGEPDDIPNARVSMDALGLIRAWDDAAEALFGWEAGAVIGRSVGDVLVPEPSRTAHWRGLARFLATGRGPVIDTTIDVQALHRGGHLIDVALTITAESTDSGWTFHAQLGAIRPSPDTHG